MRVLWIKVGGLWPLNTGGRQRTFHMLAELTHRHEVTLVTTHGPSDDPTQLAVELCGCERVVSFPFAAPKQGSARFAGSLVRSWASALPVDLLKWRVPDVRAFVGRCLTNGEADVVVADFLVAVPNLPTRAEVPVVCFSHNVEHQIWRRLANVETRWWRRQLLAVEWRKMRRVERSATKRASLTVAVSPDDRDRLQTEAPHADVVAVPTGVDVNYFSPRSAPEDDDSLVFSGSMDWYPNEDAMLHFMHDVLPLIRLRRPDVRLTIVGRRPADRLRSLATDCGGVLVTGTVDDVRPYVERAAVFVVPLRVGGGTRLKIFEALAMGKAVVSTTIGAEGLGVTDRRELRCADGAEPFADVVVELLTDVVSRRRLGLAGRKLVVERYSWATVTSTFERYLHRARERDSDTRPQPLGRGGGAKVALESEVS